MPLTKHTFTYAPNGETYQEIGVDTLPFAGDVVEINMLGRPSGDVRVETVIPKGAFVILRTKLARRGQIVTRSSAAQAQDKSSAPEFIYIHIEGINNAALVYSEEGVYPSNLNEDIPVYSDLAGASARASLRGVDNFIEYIGIPPTTSRGSGRNTRCTLQTVYGEFTPHQ